LDRRADEATDDPYGQVARREVLARVESALADLPARMQQILALYYCEELCLREIGVVLGVTESRVCQIHAEATKRLRTVLGVDASDDASGADGSLVVAARPRGAVRRHA